MSREYEQKQAKETKGRARAKAARAAVERDIRLQPPLIFSGGNLPSRSSRPLASDTCADLSAFAKATADKTAGMP